MSSSNCIRSPCARHLQLARLSKSSPRAQGAQEQRHSSTMPYKTAVKPKRQVTQPDPQVTFAAAAFTCLNVNPSKRPVCTTNSRLRVKIIVGIAQCRQLILPAYPSNLGRAPRRVPCCHGERSPHGLSSRGMHAYPLLYIV
jgi:hypothetical protein